MNCSLAYTALGNGFFKPCSSEASAEVLQNKEDEQAEFQDPCPEFN